MKEKLIIPYKKEFPYSYTLGSYATIELIVSKPKIVERIFIHPDCKNPEYIVQLCEAENIPVLFGSAAFKRIRQKENTYVLGEFLKYTEKVSSVEPHVVLVQPSGMGNLGTIIRTLAGFHIRNLAIITPAADVWNPKTIRASMGALFRIQCQQFSSFEEYCSRYEKHKLYPFMLNGKNILQQGFYLEKELYSLIFGNEATGLPEYFSQLGTSVKIPQSELVDSLNISVAVGIGVFLFGSAGGQII